MEELVVAEHETLTNIFQNILNSMGITEGGIILLEYYIAFFVARVAAELVECFEYTWYCSMFPNTK